jgi:hypothetical protein
VRGSVVTWECAQSKSAHDVGGRRMMINNDEKCFKFTTQDVVDDVGGVEFRSRQKKCGRVDDGCGVCV